MQPQLSSKRARLTHKIEWKLSNSYLETLSSVRISLPWSVFPCLYAEAEEQQLELNNYCLVISSASDLLLFQFSRVAEKHLETEESSTINCFSSDAAAPDFEEDVNCSKYSPIENIQENGLIFQKRIPLTENGLQGKIVTALSACTATKQWSKIVSPSQLILVGWNCGSVALVDTLLGKLVAIFQNSHMFSAVSCLAQNPTSTLFASGHHNGDIFLWSWQLYDTYALPSSDHDAFVPYMNVTSTELERPCFYTKPLVRIGSQTTSISMLRFSLFPELCLVSNMGSKLQLFNVQFNDDSFCNIQTPTIFSMCFGFEASYGRIMDSIVTSEFTITAGEDDIIRIYRNERMQDVLTSLTNDICLPDKVQNQICQLQQHNSYVTSLQLSANKRILVSASLDGYILFWLLQECLPRRYVHPMARIYLEDVSILSIQLLSRHIIAFGKTSTEKYVFQCFALPLAMEKEIM